MYLNSVNANPFKNCIKEFMIQKLYKRIYNSQDRKRLKYNQKLLLRGLKSVPLGAWKCSFPTSKLSNGHEGSLENYTLESMTNRPTNKPTDHSTSQPFNQLTRDGYQGSQGRNVLTHAYKEIATKYIHIVPLFSLKAYMKPQLKARTFFTSHATTGREGLTKFLNS